MMEKEEEKKAVKDQYMIAVVSLTKSKMAASLDLSWSCQMFQRIYSAFKNETAMYSIPT